MLCFVDDMLFLCGLTNQPMHGTVLHAFVSVEFPEQSSPPPDGAGLSHNLTLEYMPIPQVTEHALWLPHSPHCPSTTTIARQNEC